MRTDRELREWRQDLAQRLRAGGVVESQRELGYVVGAVCRTPIPAVVSRDEEAAILRAVDRRASGMPLAYALGSAGFRYLDLEVDDRVLIPRPETEDLVQTVLDWAWRRGGEVRGLEIGVGSGAIILSLAEEGPFSRLVGTDISPDALAVARRNAHRVGTNRVSLLVGSLFAPLHPAAKFDVIVSNPPYLTPREFDQTDRSVRGFEPAVALVSPPDGMSHLEAICRGARSHLSPGGLLALEIDARRAAPSVEAAKAAGLAEVRVRPDVFGRDRILTAQQGSC